MGDENKNSDCSSFFQIETPGGTCTHAHISFVYKHINAKYQLPGEKGDEIMTYKFSKIQASDDKVWLKPHR